MEAGDRKAQGSLVAPSRCCEVGGVTGWWSPTGRCRRVRSRLCSDPLNCSRDSVAHSPFGSRRPARPRVDRVRTPRSSLPAAPPSVSPAPRASAAPSGKEREGGSCRDLAAWPPRPPTACSPGQDVRRSRSSFCAARGLASLSSGAHAGSGVRGRAVSRGRPYAWPAPHHPATSGSMPCSSSNLLLNSSPRRLDSKKWEYQVTTSGVSEAGKIITPVTRDLSSWLVCQSLVGFIVVSFLLRPESPGGLIKPAPPGASPRALRRCQPVPALSCLSWCLPRRVYCYINQLLEWLSGLQLIGFSSLHGIGG